MPPFERICQELAKLPVELAHQIIGDLKVWDVFKLLWYDDSKVNALVSSQPQCRTLLGDDEEAFSQTRQMVKSYFAMYVKVGLPFKPPGYGHVSWSIDVLVAHKLDKPAREVIMKELRDSIQSFLYTQIYAIMDLEQYVDRSVFSRGIPDLHACNTVQDLGECMDTVLHAKKALFKQASDQLHWAASLMEQNPDILKRTLDPEQKRRPNTAHIVSRMRYTANRFRKCDVKDFIATEYFAFYFFPIIPFDTALTQLLWWMEKYGFITENGQINNSNHRQHAHSQPMEKHANMVMEGLPYFFTGFPSSKGSVANDKGDVLRTVHTSLSDQDNAAEGLFFTVHRIASHLEFKLPVKSQAREPSDKREQAWLASFVELYRYLEMLEKRSMLALEESL